MDTLSKELEKYEEVSEKLIRALNGKPTLPGTTNTAEVKINAGGVGLWLATTCCVVTFILFITMSVVGCVAYIHQENKMSRMQDYLNAIYMMAPQLKPKEKESGKS